MRTITSLVLVALTAACAVGPGYHRPSLGMPDGWRPSSASEDSLRPFYDSLRTSRDTLLPHGGDTAPVPFPSDTSPAGARGATAVGLKWLALAPGSVLGQLGVTALRDNRDVRPTSAAIDEFR